MLFKKQAILEVSYFARNIYETEAVTLGFCYIKDLKSFIKIIQFDFEIRWISNQTIVQQNYIIYFHIQGSFLTTFCTSFWKRAHNSKEIVNIQGLFVLIIGYVVMKTYTLTKYYYIIARVYFIYRLLILFITTFSFLMFLYTLSCRQKRDYLHASSYRYFVLYYVNTMKKYQTLSYHIHTYDIKKVQIWTWSPQTTI